MNLAELKAQHPDVYKAARDEGVVEGLAQGRTAGYNAGKEEGKAEGAQAERERIQAIESLHIPGAEKVIAENKFKPEATKGSVAELIIADQRAVLSAAAATEQREGAALARQAEGLGAQLPAGSLTADSEVDAAVAKLKAKAK